MAITADEPIPDTTHAPHSKFFARMALVTLGLVLISFPTRYFIPVATGSKHWPPLVHIHALFFFSWIFLYAWQTHLASTGRVSLHREFGLAGIAISAIMVPLAVSVAAIQARTNVALGIPDPFWLPFINLMGITSFAGMMTASIASVTRHREWHRRFTYAAALILAQFACSRLFQMVSDSPNLGYYIMFVPDVFFLSALMLHDRKVLGRLHPATIWITAILLPLHAIEFTIAHSHAWASIAPFLLHLSG